MSTLNVTTTSTNTLTGQSVAGSIAVTGEGNSTTTNLQQGLAKNFMSATQPGSVGDSFNVGSTTDEGSGLHTVVLTNNTATTAHAVVTGMQDADMACLSDSNRATNGYMVTGLSRADSLSRVDGDHFSALFGDLA